MPVLCGIPAAICPPDARVREMAEFYEIPMVTETDLRKRDLYDLYCDTSYRAFNTNFAAKFDAYEAFLKERNIVKAVNSTPMLQTDPSEANIARLVEIEKIPNRERIDRLHRDVCRNPVWQMYDAARKGAIRMMESRSR